MKNYVFLFITILVVFVSGCEFFEKNSDPEPFEDWDLIYFSDAKNPAIFAATNPDNETITYYGNKDIDGTPVNIDRVSVKYPDEEGLYVMHLDEQQKPTVIFSPDGSTMEFHWINDQKFRLDATFNNGGFQISFPVHTDTLYQTGGEKCSELTSARKRNIRTNHPLRSDQKKYELIANPVPVAINIQHHAENKDYQDTQGDYTIFINKCGRPVKNANVIVTMFPTIKYFEPVTKNNGDGTYSFSLPEVNIDPNYKAKCEKLASKLSMGCMIWSSVKPPPDASPEDKTPAAICERIAFKLKWTPDALISAKEKAKILKNCSNSIKTMPMMCALLEEHQKSGESNQRLCEILREENHHGLLEEYEVENYAFNCVVQVPGQILANTELVSIDPNQSADIDLNIDGELGYEYFTVEPLDPRAGTGYTIRAMVVCPDPEGSYCSLSVAGNDGYTNDVGMTLIANHELSLYVPGGAANVTDVIILTLDGKKYHRDNTFY